MGSPLTALVDETGVRVGQHLHGVIEQIITDVMQSDIYGPLEEAGAPKELAEVIEARFRHTICATLVMEFMKSTRGWGEIMDIIHTKKQQEREGQ